MQEPDALIDVYDRNGNVYSIKQRSEIDKKKDILRCVVVLILNPKNELFLVRARDSTFPGKFGCSAAGLVRHRENPIEAVERTMKRELGVAIPLHSLGEKFYEFYETEGIKRYMRVYYGTVEEGTLEPNMNDIESYEWVPFNDVEKRFPECMPTLKEAYKEVKKALRAAR